MAKIKLSDILRPNARIHAVKLDLEDPKVARLIKHTQDQQSKILALKQIDYHRLKNTIIVI